MKSVGLALLMTMMGCAKSEDGEKPSVPVPDPVPAEEMASGQTVALHLTGVSSSGSVRVRVAALELKADGGALPALLDGHEFDLGDDQSATEVTTFALPTDAVGLSITLRFQPEGMLERDGKTQPLDLRGPAISLVANAEQMRASGNVALDIDLAKSLIERGEQVFLLPMVNVRY